MNECLGLQLRNNCADRQERRRSRSESHKLHRLQPQGGILGGCTYIESKQVSQVPHKCQECGSISPWRVVSGRATGIAGFRHDFEWAAQVLATRYEHGQHQGRFSANDVEIYLTCVTLVEILVLIFLVHLRGH